MLRGLVVVGLWKAHGPAKRGDGTTVAGFFTIEIDRGTAYPIRLGYNVEDFNSGEETAIARQLRESPPQEGDLVAVKVATRASGKYVNLDALAVFPVEADTFTNGA